MSKLGNVACVILLGLVIVSCNRSIAEFPPRDLDANSAVTLPQVTAAIQDAARATGWESQVIRPGLIEATKRWGGSGDKHNIVVEIVYDTSQYRIDYKSSRQLGYDGSNIHNSYNQLTGELYQAIHDRTSALGS